MPEIRNQILDIFLCLTEEQQELAFDFVLSMLGAEQEEVASAPKLGHPPNR